MAAAGFLDLPAELRNEIYGLVFSSLSTPLHNPWDDGQSCTTIMSLFLTCRHVSSEISSLLWQDHIGDLLLHFDSSVDLITFMESCLPRWPKLKDANFRLRVTAHDKRQISSIEDQMNLIGALLVPVPKEWTYQFRHTWTTSLCRRLDLWRTLHNSPKRLVRDPMDVAAGRKRIRYWVSDGFKYMGADDFKYTCFSWDTWFSLPMRQSDSDAKRGPGGRHVGTEHEAGQEVIPEFGAAGWDVAAGRKVRSECVVIEGRIADAVEAWCYDRRKLSPQSAFTRNT